jgi:hypothetical protein
VFVLHGEIDLTAHPAVRAGAAYHFVRLDHGFPSWN